MVYLKRAGIAVLVILTGCFFSNAQTTQQLVDSAGIYRNRDYLKTISFADAAYKKAMASKQTILAGESAFWLGIGNYMAGNYEHAVRWYFEADKLFTGARDTVRLGRLYTEMCVLYTKIKKFKEADEISKKAITYSLKIRDTAKLAPAVNNRGLMFLDGGKIDSALNAFKFSYSLYKKLKDKVGMAYSLDYLGSAFAEKNKLKEALAAMNEAKDLRQGMGDKTGEAIAINNIGELYLKDKKPANAVPYFVQAIEKAHALNYLELEVYVYSMLSQTYQLLGQYREAYSAQSKYLKLNEKFKDEKSAKTIEELITKYEANKKEQQNKLLREENNAQQIVLSRNRIGIYALLAITVLTAILFYLLYVKNKIKEQARFRQAMLEEQQLRAQGIMNAEENERQRLARELHDGIGQMLCAARRQVEFVQPGNIEVKRDETLQMLDESIKEVRDLSHSMMPPSMLNKTLKQAIVEFTDRMNSEKSIAIRTEWVNTSQLELDETTTLMLYRSVQEIMSNIFKHAQATSIHIEMINHDSEITLMIYDDGVGFDMEALSQTSKGLGLKNIRSRIAYIGGTLQIDTSPGNGVTYIIELPLLVEA